MMLGGIAGVILRIAARSHVKDDSSPPFLSQPGVQKIEAKLSFADAGRAGHNGERAGAQAAPQMLVQFGNSRAQAIGGLAQVSLGV